MARSPRMHAPKVGLHRCERAADEAQKLRDRQKWRAWYHTPRWRALRAAQLLREPFCSSCINRGARRYATMCVHTKPHHGNANKFWCGPFLSLCAQHGPAHDGIGRKQHDDAHALHE
jgi:hypothetical protein